MNHRRNLSPVVLLIDDDKTLHLWATRHLLDAGFTLISSFSGEEGIAAFKDHHPDIVLIDVSMPSMDGFEVCAAIRSLDIGKNAPVLMMTVTEDSEKIEEAFAAGTTDFVVKPVNWDILVHRLRYMVKASNVLKRLEVSERRLCKAKQMAKLGDWEWQLEDNSLYWSDEIYTMLGIAGHDFMPDTENFKRFVHGEDIAHVHKNIVATLQTRQANTIEFRIVTAQNEERIVSQQMEAITDRHNTVTGLTGTILDITEQKNHEHKIRHMAYFDEVTQLPNRVFFLEYLAKTIKLMALKASTILTGIRRATNCCGKYQDD
jgi:PAS domain S-box-containing protein